MIEKIKSWELISNDTYRQLKAGTLVVRKAVSNPEAKKTRNCFKENVRIEIYKTK